MSAIALLLVFHSPMINPEFHTMCQKRRVCPCHMPQEAERRTLGSHFERTWLDPNSHHFPVPIYTIHTCDILQPFVQSFFWGPFPIHLQHSGYVQWSIPVHGTHGLRRTPWRPSESQCSKADGCKWWWCQQWKQQHVLKTTDGPSEVMGPNF